MKKTMFIFIAVFLANSSFLLTSQRDGSAKSLKTAGSTSYLGRLKSFVSEIYTKEKAKYDKSADWQDYTAGLISDGYTYVKDSATRPMRALSSTVEQGLSTIKNGTARYLLDPLKTVYQRIGDFKDTAARRIPAPVTRSVNTIKEKVTPYVSAPVCACYKKTEHLLNHPEYAYYISKAFKEAHKKAGPRQMGRAATGVLLAMGMLTPGLAIGVNVCAILLEVSQSDAPNSLKKTIAEILRTATKEGAVMIAGLEVPGCVSYISPWAAQFLTDHIRWIEAGARFCIGAATCPADQKEPCPFHATWQEELAKKSEHERKQIIEKMAKQSKEKHDRTIKKIIATSPDATTALARIKAYEQRIAKEGKKRLGPYSQ